MALVTEFPYRPNVCLENPSAIMSMDKGRKRFWFTWKQKKTVAMYISFPDDGGVRIHNGKEGAFAPSGLCDIVYEVIDEQSFRMTGNGTSVVFSSTPYAWSIDVYDATGEWKTAMKVRCGLWDYSDISVGIDIDDKPALYRLYWPISEGEEFFGFGERWNSIRQQKTNLLMWNIDILSGSGLYSDLVDDYCDKTQAYKNVPLVHSTNNYSIFYNTYLPMTFDIGHSDPHMIMNEIYGTQLDLYIWTGNAKENLEQYHKLTGMPYIPPKWAFDYWVGGGPFWNRPSREHAAQNYENALRMYDENRVRISVAYVENDPRDDIFKVFQDRGIRMFMWTHHRLPEYGETQLDYNDYYVKKASDPTKVMNHRYIDFTSPQSKDVICDKFQRLWDNGVCGEMVDYSDSLPVDSICHNGKTGIEMHNEYAYWFGRRMNEAFTERMGKDFILFERAGCAGSQHYTTCFAGDSYSSFLGLKRSVWQMLSAAASGFPIWGSDIGGYMLREWLPQEGPEFEELYMRWLQFGTFSPLMRNHSIHGKVHPWSNGERGLENFKYYYTLRLQLLDAIYSAALKIGRYGGALTDSMAVAYDMTPTVDMQYMFCGDFLIRPVVELGQREVEMVFPENGFYSLYDGVRYDAGTCVVEAPVERIPAFVKQGSVVPYNYYPEGVIPTWDKTQYQEAVLLTAPEQLRESEYYTDAGTWKFTSEAMEDGYQVTAEHPCPRLVVIVLGKDDATLTTDVEITNILYDHERHCTIFTLSSEWTVLHVK